MWKNIAVKAVANYPGPVRVPVRYETSIGSRTGLNFVRCVLAGNCSGLHWMLLGRDGDVIDPFGYPAPGGEILPLLLEMFVNELLIAISPRTVARVLNAVWFRDRFYILFNIAMYSVVTDLVPRRSRWFESRMS